MMKLKKIIISPWFFLFCFEKYFHEKIKQYFF